MSERYMTGVEMQAELLIETQRTRKAVEGIRNLLLIEFLIGLVAALVVIAVMVSR